MNIDFISEKFSKIDGQRRMELMELADRYYDSRQSLGQMLENARMEISFIDNEDVLFVESYLKKRMSKNKEYKPIVRGIRLGDVYSSYYNEMIGTQFMSFGEAEPMDVSILIENPFYGMAAVDMEYRVGLKYEDELVFNVCDLADVHMEKDQQFCVLSNQMMKPKGKPGDNKCVCRYRLFVTEASDLDKELAGLDFEVIPAPWIDYTWDFRDYVTVKEFNLYELGDSSKALTTLAHGSDSGIGCHLKFTHKLKPHNGKLPEIEFRLFLESKSKGAIISTQKCRAKAYVEDGEIVYRADTALWSPQGWAHLPKGDYCIGLFIFSTPMENLDFSIGDKTVKEPLSNES